MTLLSLLVPTVLGCGGVNGTADPVDQSGDPGNGGSTAGIGFVDVTVATINPIANTIYEVSISNGQKKTVGANAMVTFKTSRTGTHEISLSSVPATCTLSGDNPVVLDVLNQHHYYIAFTITCPGAAAP
jgi:hypothetical protein